MMNLLACMIILLDFWPGSSSALPQLSGYHPEVEEGARHDSKTGGFVVFADKETSMRLYGSDLSDDLEIAITTDSGNQSSACDNHVSVSRVSEADAAGDTAMVTLVVPLYPPDATYMFCLRSGGGKWLHQGSDNWKTISAELKPKKTTLLPLWVQIILIIVLLGCSGLFSGLNLGLMSLDKTELQILENSGSKREKSYAKVVKKVRKRGNYLLCTILLGNVLVNNTLTILMDDLTGSGSIAVVAATMGIVIFGEIIPQAICSRHGLAIGAKTIFFTWFFMFVTFPLSFPISLILNCVLGEEEGCVYNRARLRELLKITYAQTDLLHDEFNIIEGALELSKKTAGDIMTKFEDAYMIEISSALDFETVTKIVKSGFTRIPVYENERTNVVGLLNVKDLAFIDPDDKVKLRSVCKFYERSVNFVHEDVRLNKLLTEFKEGKCHMAMVRRGVEEPGQLVGLVTLEDVLEEILQSEIVDETDVHTDNRKTAKRALVERSFSMFTSPDDEAAHVRMSPQLSLAVFQFLSTSLEPFSCQHLSESTLQKLLKQNVVFEYKPGFSPDEEGALYVKERSCDYFILVLEGHVEVDVGKESMIFETGPFSYFGVTALQTDGQRLTSSDSVYSKKRHFTPDFSVTAKGYAMYLRISRRYYTAAVQASLFEKEISNKPKTPDSVAEDPFLNELEKVKQAEKDDEETGLLERQGKHE